MIMGRVHLLEWVLWFILGKTRESGVAAEREPTNNMQQCSMGEGVKENTGGSEWGDRGLWDLEGEC